MRLFETVDKELGPITALVNNAATLETQMRLESVNTDRLQRISSTNASWRQMCSVL